MCCFYRISVLRKKSSGRASGPKSVSQILHSFFSFFLIFEQRDEKLFGNILLGVKKKDYKKIFVLPTKKGKETKPVFKNGRIA